MGCLETDPQILERSRLDPEKKHRPGSRPAKIFEVRQATFVDSDASSADSARRLSLNLIYHRNAPAALKLAPVAAKFLRSEMLAPGGVPNSAMNRCQTDINRRSPPCASAF